MTVAHSGITQWSILNLWHFVLARKGQLDCQMIFLDLYKNLNPRQEEIKVMLVVGAAEKLQNWSPVCQSYNSQELYKWNGVLRVGLFISTHQIGLSGPQNMMNIRRKIWANWKEDMCAGWRMRLNVNYSVCWGKKIVDHLRFKYWSWNVQL